jgi:hypothetical protein
MTSVTSSVTASHINRNIEWTQYGPDAPSTAGCFRWHRRFPSSRGSFPKSHIRTRSSAVSPLFDHGQTESCCERHEPWFAQTVIDGMSERGIWNEEQLVITNLVIELRQ